MDKVTVYSTPMCSPCEGLKRILRERGIVFTTRDLLTDDEAGDYLEANGIRSSPVLQIGDRFYTGAKLSLESLEEILGKAS